MFYAIHCMHFHTILRLTGRVFSSVSQYITINTTGAEVEIFQENSVITMAANALAPCVS